MMETKKIYYTDGHASEFEAIVTGCVAAEGGKYAVILDRTAFFPEGGGQLADTGFIGEAAVADVREKNGEIFHYTDRPLCVGENYHCMINWPVRFRRMQNHGGEHIVSGIVNRMYGYNNVGFHMGADDITIDFDGLLDRSQLIEIEKLANEAVTANRKINISFPSAEELKTLEFRSKKALEGQVRIVEIEGFDRCACCAPHLGSTGEVGIIKILDFMKYKGGVRIHILSGMDALEDYHRRYEITAKISALLSVKQLETAEAVARLYDDNGKLRGECGELRRKLLAYRAAEVTETSGNICLFEDVDADGLRLLVNLCVQKCQGVCAAFSGNDTTGYKYIIGSKSVDLRAASKDINKALAGRGGGTPEMIQGSIAASAEAIKQYFKV